eukprot:4972458-Pleurochrysis_carterae.AAC.2
MLYSYGILQQKASSAYGDVARFKRGTRYRYLGVAEQILSILLQSSKEQMYVLQDGASATLRAFRPEATA